MVKFDDCPALLSRHEVQSTYLKNMISYEDALRNDIHVGEKVLAPVCMDGKYEPGTVVEGYDIRKTKDSGSSENLDAFCILKLQVTIII